MDYYLKSITFGSLDLSREPLVFPTIGDGRQIEIVLTKIRPASPPDGYRISGLISDIEWPQPNLDLLLTEISPDGKPVMLGRSENETTVPVNGLDGSFAIEGIPSGRYTFRLDRSGRVSGRAISSGLSFEVRGQDVANLDVRFDPGKRVLLNASVTRTIPGQVDVAGVGFPSFEIAFISSGNGWKAASVVVSTREFAVQIPEGEYRASVSGLPSGYVLDSLTAGPLDLSAPFLVVEKGEADRFSGAPAGAGITVRLKHGGPD